MNRNKSFWRKIAYIVAIALLLIPLAALSQPATTSKAGNSPGGKLAQLRTDYNLAEAQLGEIDPASETMKLATLGLRGVAVNILWTYANYYKKTEDWDALGATVQQIIRLQPNFLEVWDFQAHNLSYNVSVEFDNYRDRYYWVKEGIKFLITGTHYNREEPGLLNEVGWFTGQKIGRSDEQKQFRRLFREDKDFHNVYRENGVEVDQEQAIGPDGKPDNWLVARLWFNKATDAVTYSGKPIRGKTPLLFYNGGPMSQINGAAAMQKDGFFRQRAQIAWQKAADEWYSYGNREMPTSAGFNVRLNDYEAVEKRYQKTVAEIKKLVPGIEEEIRKENLAALPEDVRRAVEKPEAERTQEEIEKVYLAGPQLDFQLTELIPRTPQEKRGEVRALVAKAAEDKVVMDKIESERRIVNFVYWRERCESERTDLAQGAAADVYNADKLQRAGERFDEAKMLYERAWQAWAKIFAKYPSLLENAEAQDLIESIDHYRDLLGQMEAPFPRDFPLYNLLDLHQKGRELRQQIRILEGPAGSEPAAKPKDEGQPAEKAEVKKADEKKSDAAKPAPEKAADEKPPAAKPADAKVDAAKANKSPEPKTDEPADKPADDAPKAKE
jgi:hypothetical protein